MTDVARVKKDQEPDTGGKLMRQVWVTSGGRELPQLQESRVTVTELRSLYSSFERYARKG